MILNNLSTNSMFRNIFIYRHMWS